MSASQPVANWERSSWELRVKRVMGFRLGSFAPSMRATCALSDICIPIMANSRAAYSFQRWCGKPGLTSPGRRIAVMQQTWRFVSSQQVYLEIYPVGEDDDGHDAGKTEGHGSAPDHF